jgi:hypothetical protein
MAHLSDTQLIILSAAAQRDDRIALPLPDNLKGGAAMKVVSSLINKGLLEEINAKPDQQTWSQTADGDGMTLVITDTGLTAIGIEPGQADDTGSDAAPPSATGADTGATAEAANHDPTDEPTAPTAPAGANTPKVREGTKQAALIAMLREPDGATIAEIAEAIGWQAHTVRGAIAGALKKKLGLEVTSEMVEGRGRIYRLPAA